MMTLAPRQTGSRLSGLIALCATPAVLIFLSSNFVNVGNLAFNMIFSRWMGPELFGDLAVVLTLKLAILGVLGALQMAVSETVARASKAEHDILRGALARINMLAFWVLGLALPAFATIIYVGALDRQLDLSSPALLFILLGSLPFCAPLNVLRGVAHGHLNSTKIVLSANVEMFIRLGLAVAFWQLGFGLEGVVIAIALSIVAGWVVLIDLLPKTKLENLPTKQIAKALALTAIPFVLLQLSQVISLDGDIFLATQFLSDVETGFVAALSLFQRIQFFACFALAGVILPAVISAVREGVSYAKHVGTIAGLLSFVSVVVLTATALQPELLLHIMVGADYVPAAEHLFVVAATAVIFTINYLLATFLVALRQYGGVVLITGGALVQVIAMGWVVSASADLGAMITAKCVVQCVLCAALTVKLALTLWAQAKA